jgi:hypothetical protein
MAKYTTKMSKEELDGYLLKIESEGHSLKTTELPMSIYKTALVYYGSWKSALITLGLRQEKSKVSVAKRKWTPALTKTALIDALEKGYRKVDIHKKEPCLYATINVNYGSIEHFANIHGVDLSSYGLAVNEVYRIKEPPNFAPKEYESKDKIVAFIKQLINSGVKIDEAYLLLNHPVEHLSIKHYYGSLAEAFSLIDVYILDKNVPKRWSLEFLSAQISLGYRLNKPLNSEYIRQNAQGAEEYARRMFGSWKKAVLNAGVPIEYVELDSQKCARAGHRFEEILGEIFQDLGVNFQKYEHEKWRPDFVVGNHWIDAKLSQYTVFSAGTIEKYEPHCDELTIVFLRGDKHYDKKLTKKTRMVSVYGLLKDLSEEKQGYYHGILSSMISNELGSQTNDLTA